MITSTDIGIADLGTVVMLCLDEFLVIFPDAEYQKLSDALDTVSVLELSDLNANPITTEITDSDIIFTRQNDKVYYSGISMPKKLLIVRESKEKSQDNQSNLLPNNFKDLAKKALSNAV